VAVLAPTIEGKTDPFFSSSPPGGYQFPFLQHFFAILHDGFVTLER